MQTDVTSLLRGALRRAMRLARSTVQLAGFDVYRYKAGHHYVPDTFGRSAHKLEDIRLLPTFGPLAAATIATGRSCLYFDRLLTLYQALENVRRNHLLLPLQFIEVGVFRGGTSAFLLQAARALGLSHVRLDGFDTFAGHDPQDLLAVDAGQRVETFADNRFDDVAAFLADQGDVTLHRGRFQQTCDELPSGPVHFAHLDVDLYEPTLFALRFLQPRLPAGGIVVVDDYGFTSCAGVERAVSEFLAEAQGYAALGLPSGQCVLTRLEDVARPRADAPRASGCMDE